MERLHTPSSDLELIRGEVTSAGTGNLTEARPRKPRIRKERERERERERESNKKEKGDKVYIYTDQGRKD